MRSGATAATFIDGFSPAIGVAAGLALLGAVAGLALPGRRRSTAQTLVPPKGHARGGGGHDLRANRASNGSTRRCTAGGGEVITVSSRNRRANSAIQIAPRKPVGMLRAL